MTSSTSSSDRPARLLAAASPALILAAGVGLLLHEPTIEAPLQGGAARMASELERVEPRMLLVGNSLAKRGLELGPLAEALGVPADKALLLYAGGSRMPVWYAALKRRVFDAGYQPEIIVIATSPRWMVRNDLSVSSVRVGLDQHLQGQHDPAIARIQGDETPPAWRRVQQRRDHFRTGFVGTIRETTGRLLFGLEPIDTTARVEEVFSDEHLRIRQASRIIPIAQSVGGDDEAAEGTGDGGSNTVDESLLADVTALAAAGGARLVFIQLPVTSQIRHNHTLSAAEQRAVVSVLREGGAGFIDLSTMGLSDSAFADKVHPNADGRAQITAAAKAGLARIGAPLGQTMQPAALSLTQLFSLTPEVTGGAELTRREAAWGEAPLWIPPGGSLRVALPETWEADWGPLVAEIQVSTHGAGRGDLTLGLSSGAGTVLQSDRRMRWGRLEATPGASDTLVLSVPADAPRALVHRLTLGGEALVTLSDRSTSLLAEATITGEDPPTVSAPLTPRGAQREIGELPVAPLHAEALLALAAQRGCAPFEIVADGARLPLAYTSCRDVNKEAVPSSYCLRDGRIFFRLSEGTTPDPATDYGLRLTASRTCGEARWLHEGDVLSLASTDRYRSARHGAGSLVLEGTAIGEGPWTVSMTWADKPLLLGEVTAEALSAGPVWLRMNAGLPPRPHSIAVEISGAGTMLVSSLELRN